jgi:hypothetical protein
VSNVVSITVRTVDETAASFDGIKAGFAKSMEGMMGIAKTIGPGLAGPLVAAAGAGAAAFASMGAALGAFGLAVKPQFADVTKAAELYTKAQESAAAGSASAAKDMQAYKDALAQLPPATRATAVAFVGLKDDFKKWSDALAPKTMPIFTKGLEAMRAALPALTPLVETAASALSGFMDSISSGVKGGGFKAFMGELNGAAKQTLPDFLGALKNIGSGFAGILSAFLPFAGSMTGGLDKITKKFAEFGQGLKENSGFKDFMAGVQDKIPGVLEMFGTLAKTAIAVIAALAPFSGVGLAVAEALAKLVGAIPQGAMDFIAPTIAAIVLATKAWAVAQGILNVVLAANPVGLVVAALIAIGVALVVAYQKSQTFRVMVAAAFEGVSRAVLIGAGFILQGLKYITGAFLDLVGIMLNGAAKAFGWMPGLGDKLKAAAAGFDSIKTGADKAFDGAIKKVKEWDNNVKGMTTRVVIQGKIDDLTKKLDQAKKELESVPKGKRAELTAKIDDWNRKLLQAKVALQNTPAKKQAVLTSNITDWTNKLKTATGQLKSVPASKRSALLANIADLQSKVNAAKSLLASLRNKTVTITSYYKKVNAGEAPPYQHYAHGGIVGGAAGGGPRSGLSWVGENGPELVSLSAGSTVHTAGDSQRMAAGMGGGGGGPVINIYVQGSIRSDRELVGIIRDEFINGGFRGVVNK